MYVIAGKTTDPAYVGGDSMGSIRIATRNNRAVRVYCMVRYVKLTKVTTEWEAWSSAEPTKVKAEWNR